MNGPLGAATGAVEFVRAIAPDRVASAALASAVVLMACRRVIIVWFGLGFGVLRFEAFRPMAMYPPSPEAQAFTTACSLDDLSYVFGEEKER